LWLAAATELRAPYWDWAAIHDDDIDGTDSKLPPREVYLDEELVIKTPKGDEKVPNPLLAYHFQEPFSYASVTDRTFRHAAKAEDDPVRGFKE
jgi:hypothetical protein